MMGTMNIGTPGDLGGGGPIPGIPDNDNNGDSDENDKVTYSRVQGGTPPNASRHRISVNSDGSISIPNKRSDLNVSVGDDHAVYFRTLRGGNAEIVKFDIPKWLHDEIEKNAVPQRNYRTNPANQGGTAPKIVDPSTPGRSYELPSPWIEWLEEYATNGNVTR
jgi:hypothetical protein